MFFVTGKLFYELTQYTYHFKTAVVSWGIVFSVTLVTTIIVFVLSLQKFIDQKNKQLEEIKKEHAALKKELSKKERDHEINLKGQLESKQRIRQERDGYIARNADLEAINNNQLLLLNQMLTTVSKPELASLVKTNIAQDKKIESQVMNNVRNQED